MFTFVYLKSSTRVQVPATSTGDCPRPCIVRRFGSIISDMTWKDYILEHFGLVDRFTMNEFKYNGAFNTLLTNLFPSDEHFQVPPQKKPITLVTPESIDFTTIFVVHQLEAKVLPPSIFG